MTSNVDYELINVMKMMMMAVVGGGGNNQIIQLYAIISHIYDDDILAFRVHP